MRTIQMTLDDDLVAAVDLVSEELQTSRSAFTRQALRDALAKHHRQLKEKQHRLGYEKHPRVSEEFGDWETEQVWGEE
ncbi:MAG: CopG family transcriptional regulator [Verrucomicrobia bacterium]|nr:MAG: CopG family transcriptional regulator [Verrucomicrobiota bacterium]